MTISTLFLAFVILIIIVGLCWVAYWVVNQLGAPEPIGKIALIAIVLLGCAAIVFVVLPRLGVPV